MREPANYEIRASRHQPLLLQVGFPGVDFTGQDFSFQVRENKESAATLIDLPKGAGANAVVVAVAQVDGNAYTTITIQASKATMEAIPAPAPIGSDGNFYYGLKMSGFDIMTGGFILLAAANHA